MITKKDDEINFTEREDFYKTLIQMSPDAIFVHRESRFIFSNQTGIELLG